LGRILAALAGHLDQMERIRGRAHERGRAERLHPSEPRRRVLPAARDRERAEGARALEARSPGIASAPRARAPSKPAQKPMKRPNENGKKTRSAGSTPAPRRTNAQHRAHHSHDSGVSSQRIGCPLVPEVWWTRTYRSSGYVRLVPKGGCVAWSSTSSTLRVKGSRRKSSQSARSSTDRTPAARHFAPTNGLDASSSRAIARKHRH